MAKEKHVPAPDVVALFDTMIDAVPGVARKGDSLPYVSLNGNMYATINKQNRIGIRLAEDDRKSFLTTHEDAGAFEGVPGFVMEEYVEVPESLYERVSVLQNWFRLCHAYAKTLKPKPTSKAKPPAEASGD
jgi:hypothetical protein